MFNSFSQEGLVKGRTSGRQTTNTRQKTQQKYIRFASSIASQGGWLFVQPVGRLFLTKIKCTVFMPKF